MAKALRDFAKNNPNLVVKGGMVGTGVLSASDIDVLADLPPRDTLLAQFAGALAAPLQQLAGLVQALPRNLAYGISALIEQRQAGGEVLEVPADAAAETETEAPAEPTDEAPAEPAAEAPAEPTERGPGRADQPRPRPNRPARPRPKRRRTRRPKRRKPERRSDEPPAQQHHRSLKSRTPIT